MQPHRPPLVPWAKIGAQGKVRHRRGSSIIANAEKESRRLSGVRSSREIVATAKILTHPAWLRRKITNPCFREDDIPANLVSRFKMKRSLIIYQP
jgi:hypothetical protein